MIPVDYEGRPGMPPESIDKMNEGSYRMVPPGLPPPCPCSPRTDSPQSSPSRPETPLSPAEPSDGGPSDLSIPKKLSPDQTSNTINV